MGWWPWEWFGNQHDPLRDLDPSLRDFVQKNSPTSHGPATSQTSDSASYRDQLGLSTTDPREKLQEKRNTRSQTRRAQTQADEETSDLPLKPPPQSLYQDGRYAHLWKTYRAQSDVEEAGKSDQEKLLDIVGGYKERTRELHAAAQENCAEFQWAVHECFRTGGWSSRMTMCKAENRALNRCIQMQARFLRALGYLDVMERDPETSERMQMHADRLYHRMLRQEEMAAEAKKSGKEAPSFPPLMGEGSEKPQEGESGGIGVATPKPGKLSWDTIRDDAKEMFWKERFEGLEGEQLEIAKREFDAELAVHEQLESRLRDNYIRERREREQRHQEGGERFGDKVKRYFDFRKLDEERSKDDEQKK